MSVIGSNVLAGASGQAVGAAGYEIERSLRFNSADSAYLSRTPSSAGNRKTWTWSGWVKRSALGTIQDIFSASDGSTGEFTLRFLYDGSDTDCIQVTQYVGGYVFQQRTSSFYRDVSAWYHIVLALDTTQVTDANKVKIYVNGTQVINFSTISYPSTNADLLVNTTNLHTIGRQATAAQRYFSGHLADVHFIDGQALAPTDFGEYDDNNNWNPKAFSGTYGTNGFYLDFSDNSSNAALGYDAAGSNDWTVNNLVAAAPGLSTANEGFDVVTYTGNGSTQTISGLGFQPDLVWIKNRDASYGHIITDSVRGNTKLLFSYAASGESTVTNAITGFTSDGFTLGAYAPVNISGNSHVAWCWKAGGAASLNENGSINSQVSVSTDYGFSIVSYTGNGSAGSTIGHGLNATPKIYFLKNRSASQDWYVYTTTVDGSLDFLFLNSTAAKTDSGFTLPDSSVFNINAPSILNINGNNYVAYCWSEVSGFSKFGSYSGGTNPQTITTGFKPRFLIIRRTDTANHWIMIDSERGGTKKLAVNEAVAENDLATIGDDAQNVVEFLADGFKLTTTNAGTNVSGGTYVYAAFAGTPPGEIIDSLIDTPTNATTPTDTGAGNEVVGNYATLNPLSNGVGTNPTNGNLHLAAVAAVSSRCNSTIAVSSGKWYFETTLVTAATGNSPRTVVGIGQHFFTDKYVGEDADSYGFTLDQGFIFNNGTGTSYATALSNGDVFMCAFDLDNNKIFFGSNGTWFNSSDPAAGTSPAYTINSGTYCPAVRPSAIATNTPEVAFNFGARSFAYSAPSGFKAINTASLPDPTIVGSTAMDVVTYTGNGGTQVITTEFSPDLVWIKSRSVAYWHRVNDSVRGAQKFLYSNATDAEGTSTLNDRFTSFDATGFTLGIGDSPSADGLNQNTLTYVAWCWDAGTSTVSNTDGSITSSVRANASAGFSIVSYTGNDGSSGTVGHGLGSKPSMFIVKNRDTSGDDWIVYHEALGATKRIKLNATEAATTSSSQFNDTEPTSSVFTVGSLQNINDSYDYVAYCFTPVEGYSAFGSYVGTGTSDNSAPFVYTGFRPRWILIKSSSISPVSQWGIWDTERNSYNVTNSRLSPNTSGAEITTAAVALDVLSNGFKPRTTDYDSNQSGDTYIYAAFAEHPLKHARAR